MSAIESIDRIWLAAHPLPDFGAAADKNGRGQLTIAGGGASAPAAALLSAEAALRAGCGRVRVAASASMLPWLAVSLPEAGVIALPVDGAGELAGEAGSALTRIAERGDALLVGPGMGRREPAAALVAAMLESAGTLPPVVLDAAACAGCGALVGQLAGLAGGLVLTPHPGEAADLLEVTRDEIEADLVGSARRMAERFGAAVALRSTETIIATPGGDLLHYAGGGIGLATGGSGDVCVGIIAGLLARGADPLTALAWGVFAHGEAGGRLGGPGYLARELLPMIPRLLAG